MEENQLNTSGEIDLRYFFRPISNALKSIGNGIRYYFALLGRNALLFLLIIVLITGGVYLLRFTVTPAYETEAIFVSHVLPGKYCSTLLDNLGELQKNKNAPLLAEKLNISEDAVSKIVSITTSSVKDSVSLLVRDTLNTPISIFTVTLILRDMKYLDTIQSGLLAYLENNPYAIKRKEARIKSLQLLKASLNKKTESLDSLKRIVNSSIVPRSEGKGIILGQPIDPVEVYQAEVVYFKQQLDIDEELYTIDNVEILQPFLKLNEYNYPNHNLLVIKAFLISIALALIFTPIFGKKPK